MPFLIGILILITFILFCYIYIKIKLKRVMTKYGISSLKEIIEKAEFDTEDLPKSLSSMDSVYLERIKEEFPDMNINELKRESEKIILDFLEAIEKKDSSKIKSEKVKAYVDSKINDLKYETITYTSIKFHKTVVNKYENSKTVATIYFSSSLEYFLKQGNKPKKKVQDRYKLEWIYIIDASVVPASKKSLGLNCPNCGSPIKSVKIKKCSYCGTSILDIVKRSWICNDIINY